MKTWQEKLEEQIGLTKEQADALAQESIDIVQKKIWDELFKEATPIVVHEYMESGKYKEFGLNAEAISPFIKDKVRELYIERSEELENRILNEAAEIYKEKSNEMLTKFLCQKLFNQQLVQFNMMAAEYRDCRDCGEEFGMQLKEIEFFKSKDLKMPVRCPKCRQARKVTVGAIGNDTLKHGCTPEQGIRNMLNNMPNVGSKTNFSAMAEALRKAGKVK